MNYRISTNFELGKLFLFHIYILINVLIKYVGSSPCLREINPEEIKRSYSSVFNLNNIGEGYARSKLDSLQAWSAKDINVNQWIKIDLDQEYEIIGIILQARKQYTQYVTKYNIKFNDLKDQYITDLQNLKGVDTYSSYDVDKRFYVFLSSKINARYIILNPTEWVNHISLRMGVLVIDSNSEQCVQHIYYDFNKKLYQQCGPTCTCCCGSNNNCVNCNDNYFPKENDLGNCLNSNNSNGYFLDTNSFLYKKCNEDICVTCKNNKNTCLECKDGFYKIEIPSQNEPSECFDPKSKTEYYVDADFNMLKPCHQSCKRCSSYEVCSECQSNYFFLLKKVNALIKVNQMDIILKIMLLKSVPKTVKLVMKLKIIALFVILI